MSLKSLILKGDNFHSDRAVSFSEEAWHITDPRTLDESTLKCLHLSGVCGLKNGYSIARHGISSWGAVAVHRAQPAEHRYTKPSASTHHGCASSCHSSSICFPNMQQPLSMKQLRHISFLLFCCNCVLSQPKASETRREAAGRSSINHGLAQCYLIPFEPGDLDALDLFVGKPISSPLH